MNIRSIFNAPVRAFRYLKAEASNAVTLVKAYRKKEGENLITPEAQKAAKLALVLDKPKIQRTVVDANELKALLQENAEIENLSYTGQKFPDSEARKIKFNNCDFSKVEFDFHKYCSWEFEGCNMPNANFDFERTMNFTSANVNFNKCNMPNSSFGDNKEIICANFLNSNLEGSSFKYHFGEPSWIIGSNLRKTTHRYGMFGLAYKLIRCDLRDANWQGVIFNKAQVDNCDFRGASLIGADFKEGDYRSSRFEGADLRLAIFNQADLDPAKMQGAMICGMGMPKKYHNITALTKEELLQLESDYEKFKGKYLSSSSLVKGLFGFGAIENKNFSGENLSEFNLMGIYIPPGADFSGADFSKSRFLSTIAAKADFKYAKFKDTKLEFAIFDQSDFRAAHFQDLAIVAPPSFFGASLESVSFQGANLDGANLSRLSSDDWKLLNISGASLVAANLENAVFLNPNTLGNPSRINREVISEKEFRPYAYHYPTNMRRANLKGVQFIFAETQPWSMKSCDFSGADLSNSRFENVTMAYGNQFITTNFNGASFINFRPLANHENESDHRAYDFRSFAMLASFEGASFRNSNWSNVTNVLLNMQPEQANDLCLLLDDLVYDGSFRRSPTCFLPHIDFTGLDLRALDFRSFDAVHIQGSNFSGANLQGVDLSNVCLYECLAECADLRGTNIEQSLARWEDFVSTVYLRGARFDEATKKALSDMDPEEGRFVFDKMQNNFQMLYLDLSNRDLSKLNLARQDLRGTNLEKSIMREANLKDAMLDGSNLKNVNWDGVKLEGAKIYGAKSVHPRLKAGLEGGETAELDLDRRMGY